MVTEAPMNSKQLLALAAATLVSSGFGITSAQQSKEQYVQVAQIEVDLPQLESYKAAVREQISAAIREEPGVLVLYAVSEKDNPAHVIVFEIYRDVEAYRSHLETTHFKKYKAVTEKMVNSLTLIRTTPIIQVSMITVVFQ
jgi:quinol monooxygenase YgiN